MSSLKIEKQRELKAPLDRVWKALTDSQQFGQWFHAAFDGPFVAGQSVVARMTLEGFQDHRFRIDVKVLEEPFRFAFDWCSYPEVEGDRPSDAPTRVEFLLTAQASGTLVTIIETGFEAMPADRRFEAFRSNDEGWGFQLGNLEEYVR